MNGSKNLSHHQGVGRLSKYLDIDYSTITMCLELVDRRGCRQQRSEIGVVSKIPLTPNGAKRTQTRPPHCGWTRQTACVSSRTEVLRLWTVKMKSTTGTCPDLRGATHRVQKNPDFSLALSDVKNVSRQSKQQPKATSITLQSFAS